MKIVGIIPARYKATRFYGKPLADILGKPMIQWVYQQAIQARKLDQVIVATDDRSIKKVVERFGGQALLTSTRCASGTERVAEAARIIKADVYINIQGDEPLIHPQTIDEVCKLFKDKKITMGTAACRLMDSHEFSDPNVVKVALDKDNFSLYFSRSLIPYPRHQRPRMNFYKHLGIYGYRRDFLFKFINLKHGVLEQMEGLEQLRVLENGFKIKVCLVQHDSISISVDTPQDLDHVRQLLSGGKS